jgi:glycosyltransferase EpsH
MYNGKAYIESTVNEICKISCSKEILIIDDGSKDKSYEFAVEQFKNTDYIKVLKKPNGGIADTRNFGLNNAIGDFILFVDQDDRVNPKTIEKAVLSMKESSYSAVMWTTMFEYVDGTSRVCDDVKKEQIANRQVIVDNIIPDMLSREVNEYTSYPGHVWGGLFRRGLINNKQIRFKRFVDYEDDLLFVFDYLLQSDNILFIPVIGYYWKTNPNSYSHAFNYVENYIEKSELLRKYIEHEYLLATGRNLNESIVSYFKQYTIIGAIKNACGVGNKGKSDVIEIEKKSKEDKYIRAFRNGNAHIRDRRERITYRLISLGLVRIAVLLAKKYYAIRNR